MILDGETSGALTHERTIIDGGYTDAFKADPSRAVAQGAQPTLRTLRRDHDKATCRRQVDLSIKWTPRD